MIPGMAPLPRRCVWFLALAASAGCSGELPPSAEREAVEPPEPAETGSSWSWVITSLWRLYQVCLVGSV